MTATSSRSYVVRRSADGACTGQVENVPTADFPAGEVTLAVRWSSLNYKDALAATGHRGVAPQLPHVPGIDAAGVVETSSNPALAAGQPVLATSYGLGATRWGGWSERLSAPAEWVLPLPPELSPREAMILGTAGLTAALSVAELERFAISPASGPVLVTGATGGVGCLAVMLLAKLGYEVAAATGKSDAHQWLRELGAAQVLSREQALADSGKPLLAPRWAAAVDTVGGAALATIVRSLRPGGVAAACGLVGGVDVPLNVYPFLLRGVSLAGIDSAECPHARRLEMWRRLAGPWRLEHLDRVAVETDLEHVGQFVPQILAGQVRGRVLVRVAAGDD